MTVFRTSGGTMGAPQTRMAQQDAQRDRDELTRKLFDAAGEPEDDDDLLPEPDAPQKAYFADAIANAWQRGPDARHENADADDPPSIENAWRRGPR